MVVLVLDVPKHKALRLLRKYFEMLLQPVFINLNCSLVVRDFETYLILGDPRRYLKRRTASGLVDSSWTS